MLRDAAIRLFFSALGVIFGLCGFFVLFVGYGNHDVGFWSILSGTLAAVCFHLHWVKAKDSLDTWHTTLTLRNINVVGFVGAVAGITAAIWYLFLTCYNGIPIWPISESTAISAVWALMCGKWGIFLTYYSHKYEIFIREGSSSILIEGNA